MTRVFVTGFGMVSAIGDTAEENLAHLRQGTSGISPARHLPSRYADLYPFGEVDHTTEALRQQFSFDTTPLTRTDLLAHQAFQEALEHSRLTEEATTSFRTALISATTVGGMCNMEDLYNDANRLGEPSPYSDSYSNGCHTQTLARQYGIQGFTGTINTACSASANAIMLGTRLIRSGRADRAIVGGTDSLAQFTVNGFNALQIFSAEPCRPFDQDRDGLNLGEGAAYLVLEAEEVCLDKPCYAEVVGYGNTNDAYHPSSLSEEGTGPVSAMQKALRTAAINASAIGHINTHGTATENNDQVEALALQKVFGEQLPPYVATKSYTGHTLAAAGAVEAIYSILSLHHQELFPSLRCETSVLEQPPVREARQQAGLDYVMSNSFGFAGNCTSLIFQKA